MSRRLGENLSSRYFEAANKMKTKTARKRIVAYVESYDDVFFWRTALSRFEDDKRYFEVMLPSRNSLKRGKKSVLMNLLSQRVGECMIACVDADLDYLLQGVTVTSREINSNPYILHTYVYAIENYQCYAPSLHNVAVAVTLNDHRIFDFNEYLTLFSEACHPLFVWLVYMYRIGHFGEFSLTDFGRIVEPGGFSIEHPERSLQNVSRKAKGKVAQLRRRYPEAEKDIQALTDELRMLGVTAQNTYLYIQGHYLFDSVVAPIMSKVCNRLRTERENEITQTSIHHLQRNNEMACYERSIEDSKAMLKKNLGYMLSTQFLQLQKDIEHLLNLIPETAGKDNEHTHDFQSSHEHEE